ncbi:MAG TPA: DUF488 domain-containing protein [Casimicrobiaceae bacterium]|nr:DUF488 domain-containing protein [Casimicrobiaceae bacterium]
MQPTIWTIGHSNRSSDELIALLQGFGIEALADVRRFPGSRRLPQFGQEALAAALERHAIAYLWLPSLGGRRKPRPDTENTGWRNDSFRGYADHMETDEFATGLDELVSLGCAMRTAIMCAEALWWRCHRSLIADALEVLGWTVLHIMGPGQAVRHPMTSPARVIDGGLSYASDVPVQTTLALD